MRPSLFLIFASILVIPDLYIWFFYLRKKRVWYSLIFFIPLLYVLMVEGLRLFYVCSPVLTRWLFFMMICLSAPKGVFWGFDLISKIVGHWSKNGRVKIHRAAVIISVISFIIAIYTCTLGRLQLKTDEQDLTFSDLPAAFDGYRVVQISDLHLGAYSNSNYVEKLVKQVNDLHPDMIVFTGDLVNMKASEVDNFREILSQLSAKDGVFSVLGNHDYGQYARYPEADGAEKEKQKIIDVEQAMGWTVLNDAHQLIYRGSDSLAIVGVGDIGKPPFPQRGNLSKARKGLSNNVFQILLSHDPNHWRLEVLPKTDIELTLSGHTHAMQVKLGNFSPVKWMYDEWGGLYEEEGQKLYVSIGVGGAMPFRLGATPEINVFTLKQK